MKLNGKKIEGPSVETIIIPRGEDTAIVLKAQAVLDMDEFEKLCPPVEPPYITKKVGDKPLPDFEDEDFKKDFAKRGLRRFQYIILKSLEATENLEWETIKISDPNTWDNLDKELRDAGFSPPEIGLIYRHVTFANALSDDKITEARNRFFDTLQSDKSQTKR